MLMSLVQSVKCFVGQLSFTACLSSVGRQHCELQ